MQHAEHGHLAQRPLRVEVEPERPLERRERELVRAQSPLERVTPQRLDEVGAADDDPGLGAAEELVAGEADEIGAGGEALLRGRLVLEVHEDARAEVVDQRQPMALRDRREVGDRRLLGEADDAEVRLVHAQEHGRLGADRPLVVGGARPVRRAHLAQQRAGAREHVRDPEAVADLDQLAARDEHLAPLGQRRKREHDRGRVVVHDERALGTGQTPQDRRDVILSRAPPTGGKVVLEVRVAPPDLERPRERGLRERGAPEVRVDDHPGRVQGPPQARRPCRLELAQRRLDQVAGISPRRYLFTRARESLARRLDRQRPGFSRQAPVAGELVDRREIAQLPSRHQSRPQVASVDSCGVDGERNANTPGGRCARCSFS